MSRSAQKLRRMGLVEEGWRDVIGFFSPKNIGSWRHAYPENCYSSI